MPHHGGIGAHFGKNEARKNSQLSILDFEFSFATSQGNEKETGI
jgi:hypothetical protein